MSFSFPTEKMQEVLASDEGFRKVLSSLPHDEAENIKNILSSPSSLSDLLHLLPEKDRDTAQQFLDDIINIPQEALLLFNQCRFFEARAKLEKTISLYFVSSFHFTPGLEQCISFVVKRTRALCHDLLGRVEWELGNVKSALKNHSIALDLAMEVGDIDAIAKAQLGTGVYYWNQGDIEKGEEACLKALETLSGSTADRWRTGNRILTTLSVLYGQIGKIDEAFFYAETAVDKAWEANDSKILPLAINNLAVLCGEQGEHALAADELEKGLLILADYPDPSLEVLLLNNHALSILAKKDPEKDVLETALRQLEKAQGLSRAMPSLGMQALVSNSMGLVHQLAGDWDQAKESFGTAISMYKHLGASIHNVQVLINMALLLKKEFDDLPGACLHLREAVQMIEEVRFGLSKETYRISYADKEIEPYGFLIKCLVDDGRSEEAFEYVGRSKSRALLDFLLLELVGSEEPVSESSYFKEALQLLAEMGELKITLEKSASLLSPGFGEGENDNISRESQYRFLLEDLERKEQLFKFAYEKVLSMDPDKSFLLKVQSFQLENISSQLDDETVLLELYQDDEYLFLFLVFPDSRVKTFTVDICREDAWRKVRNIVDSLKTRVGGINVNSHDYIRHVRQPLAALFELLFQPLMDTMGNFSRLIIIPHLFWHYLPFHALYNKEKHSYLCDRYEIGYCSSSAILKMCREKNYTGRQKGLIMCRNNGDLPHVDREGELLAGAFYPYEKYFKNENAHLGHLAEKHESYDVIHLACHGYFNDEQPFLSHIDIAPDQLSERATFMLDFFRYRFDCSLVTLSVCDSGLTQYTKADELVGMTRGLFSAGAAAVMVSLWQVADNSTCTFMENFYWQYLKNGETKTRAQQLAMQTIKASDEFSHPYFWAPFVVSGDWR